MAYDINIGKCGTNCPGDGKSTTEITNLLISDATLNSINDGGIIPLGETENYINVQHGDPEFENVCSEQVVELCTGSNRNYGPIHDQGNGSGNNTRKLDSDSTGYNLIKLTDVNYKYYSYFGTEGSDDPTISKVDLNFNIFGYRDGNWWGNSTGDNKNGGDVHIYLSLNLPDGYNPATMDLFGFSEFNIQIHDDAITGPAGGKIRMESEEHCPVILNTPYAIIEGGGDWWAVKEPGVELTECIFTATYKRAVIAPDYGTNTVDPNTEMAYGSGASTNFKFKSNVATGFVPYDGEDFPVEESANVLEQVYTWAGSYTIAHSTVPLSDPPPDPLPDCGTFQSDTITVTLEIDYAAGSTIKSSQNNTCTYTGYPNPLPENVFPDEQNSYPTTISIDMETTLGDYAGTMDSNPPEGEDAESTEKQPLTKMDSPFDITFTAPDSSTKTPIFITAKEITHIQKYISGASGQKVEANYDWVYDSDTCIEVNGAEYKFIRYTYNPSLTMNLDTTYAFNYPTP